MEQLEPNETDLVGQWVFSHGRVVGDPTNDRIEELVSGCLRKVATDESGWDTLYKDPRDGRLWELTYPNSGYHGGGPLRLTNLSYEEATSKYGNVLDAQVKGGME